MIWRAAQAADLPGLLAFLRARESGSMFPLVALAGHGLRSGDDPHQLRVWLTEDAAGVAGLLGLNRAGMLFPQAPGADWRGLRALLHGQAVRMAIGPNGQVPQVLAALGLAGVPRRHAVEEPGFVLDLAEMAVPGRDGVLAVPGAAHQQQMIGWRAAYLAEVFAMPAPEAAA